MKRDDESSLNSSPRNHDKFKINRRIISQSRLVVIHPPPGLRNRILNPKQTQEKNNCESATETEAATEPSHVVKQKGRKQLVCVCVSRLAQWKRKIFCVFPQAFPSFFAIHFWKLLQCCFSVLHWPLTGLNAFLRISWRNHGVNNHLEKNLEQLFRNKVTNYECWIRYVALLRWHKYGAKIQCRRGSHAATLSSSVQR